MKECVQDTSFMRPPSTVPPTEVVQGNQQTESKDKSKRLVTLCCWEVPLTFGQIFSRLCTFTATHSVGTKDTRRLNTRIGTGDPYILRTGILLLHKSFDETISSMKTLFPTAIHVTVTTECLSSFKVPVKDLLIFQFLINCDIISL